LLFEFSQFQLNISGFLTFLVEATDSFLKFFSVFLLA
jgi:hypothetical protein